MREAKLNRVREYYMKEAGMTERKLKNRIAKEEAKEIGERNQKPVKDATITIEWKKSQTWGNCPRAEIDVRFEDGTYGRGTGYYASGCGYDKESTVVAQACNEFFRYLLWNREDMDNSKHPYGIRLDYLYSPHFEGGVGTSCYYSIFEFLGYEFKRISSGKTFDVYQITKK
jgi:hypothetical protein